jgi:hypothetical protein
MSAPASRLGRQIAEVTAALRGIDARFALIGGLALASHKVVRATQDVDLLVDAEESDDIHAVLLQLGYECLHRSDEAGNYSRKDERVDFLYASRPIARRLLAGAAELKTSLGELRVISTEGLMMSSFEKSADVHMVAEGGVTAPITAPVDPFQALDDLMVVIEELCPVWPEREPFANEARNRL